VTIEPSVDLAFSDAEAVEAMLDASQTNPEPGLGPDVDPSFLRGMGGDGKRLLAGLLRVAGPARGDHRRRAVVLVRELTTGLLAWESAVSVVHLVALALVGLTIVRRRLDALLLT
jgi:hypothetical protein